MENLSHSFSKKNYHGSSGFITTASKSLYDDVFGGPPKFGVPTLAPRYEDYTEIFGGFHSSRTSSIPILDLPLVDDQVSFDVESSHFDYSEIFGGFHVFDFALSYEDLVRQSTSASGYDSSDEAWSPAQSETLSDESDPSAFSERSQSSSGADVHYSSDGTRQQFNISYHKTSQRNDGVVSNGAAHVTHLHAVPGYTYTVSGSRASRSTEDKEPPPREVETLDLDHNVDLGGTVLEDKRFKRSTSPNMSSSYIMNGTDLKLPEEFSEASCTPEKPFLTVSDISLRTRPSGLPPPSRPPPAKKGDFDRLNSRLKASKTSAFERKQGDNSQPYFDVEEYASSSAAASTAAIKDAMEKAQAKLRSAKELMERKKQDLKCYAKLQLEDSVLEERPSRTFDKDDKAQSTCVETVEEVFGSTEVISGNNEDKKTFKFTGKGEGSEQDKPNMSSQQPHKAEGRVAWREGAEYFEVVETYPPCRSPEKVKNESGLLRNMDLHEHRRFEAVTESLDSLETCKKVAANEAPDCKEDSEEKVGKVSHQWDNKYQWSKEDDLCSQLEHQETVTAEENLFDFNVSEKNVKAEERFSTSDAEHIDIKLMEDCEIEDCEGGLRDVVYETRNGPRINECEQKDSQFRADDLMKKENEGAETKGRANGACKGKDSDVKTTEVLEQHENKTRAPLASEEEFESRSEEASALEDSEQTSAFDGMLEELHEQADLETGFQSSKGEPEVGMPNLLPYNVCTREDTVDHGNDQIKRTGALDSTASNGHSTNLSGAGTCTGKVTDRLKKEGFEMENHQKVMEERAANAKKIGDALAAVLEDLEILSSTGQRAAAVSAQKIDGKKEMGERPKKESKQEEEYLRKLEEEREREREREKDRMSVTREALERSYLEARQRVERAAIERATARERSSAEQEARLRAERAAVERATVEARQRAFEKAMAEKALQEPRDRMERSSSENFSAHSRITEMRQSSSTEQHEHQSTETSKLSYSYSSAHAGIEGESPQRCKARLERYRRTSERAAKALAEKNMRDLLAQREQAERNRLADNLDAEVKRWSSGKEGNLRALLSTLQYILGPNSGWQPIPLTEVITSAAVKKAYRKATLCVHPDKLQQRGATIQQKYICEKVFDLLKEAWNRFNSEER